MGRFTQGLNRPWGTCHRESTDRGPEQKSTSVTVSQYAAVGFILIEDSVGIIVVIEMVFNTVIVVVELTCQWVAIILLEPVGKSVVVVIGVSPVS